MKKSIIIFIAGLLGLSRSYAQASFGELEKNKVIYPSPTAAGLGKYGEFPVSLYTGLVNIGQDIVTVKSGHLALDVSLSYHASGNKPSDIPGWVGLGMSLNAGGVITRVIKDLPDDAGYGFYNANTTLQNLWNTSPNAELIERYYSGTIDPRSDVYQYNFCGKAGEFFFDWDGNIHFKQQVPFKIQVLNGPGGFAGFEITTEDGTVYRFDQAEHTGLGPMAMDPPASSWYLTRISNLYGDNIVLKYTQPMGKYRYKQYSTRKEVAGDVILATGPFINVNTSVDEVIYLDEIDFSNGKLLFGKSKRLDPYFVPAGITSSLAEEQKLEMITLKDNNNTTIKQWKFEYFENSTERLKLKNLIAQGSDQSDVQKYSFSYNFVTLPLPSPGTNAPNPYMSNEVDYWGYYNGWPNGDDRIPFTYLPEYDQYVGFAHRSINFYYVRAEILEKITYPTGGYTTFQYEPNDYSIQGASLAAAQNPMTYKVDLNEYYSVNYDRDEGGFDTDPNAIYFTLTEPTHVHYSYSCGADGPSHGWATPGQSYAYDLTMAAGTHSFATLFRTAELLQSANSDVTKAHMFLTVYKEGPTLPYYAKPGPGARIQSISTNDGITTTTRSFEYKSGDPYLDPKTSSGFLSVFPAFYAPLQDIAWNIHGYMIASDPINDLGEGAPVTYSRVVERFQDNSYIVHNFRGQDNYPDINMPFTNGYSNSLLAHMTSNEWQRGQETNTVYYDVNGVKQKEIVNDYYELPGDADVQAIELKPTVGIYSDLNSDVNNINATLTNIYYIHSGFFYNGRRTETTYDKNGQNPITTYVKKYFDNNTHLQPTRIETGGSDGSVLTTATSFSADFAPGTPFIDYMQANHLLSFPVEQVVTKQKAGVNSIVSGNIITYKTTGAGQPDQLLKLEAAGPISQANFKFSNRLAPASSQPAPYSADTRYKPVLTYTQYDNKGNLLEAVSRNGTTTSYLWGYNQEYPVAQIVGADYTTALGKITNPSMLTNPTSDGALRTELNKLRTIPAALTSTYTYAPLIGVTSETDPNNRTAYYEYDPFSRLSVIRDKDNNVMKKFCYNYAGKPDQCNFYQSAPIDNDYYSQNCPSGQAPVAYHVTLVGGMFTGVDQQNANQIAQQYAQDQANQHGGCQLIYKSNPIDNDYYSQNCPSGQVPVAYHVTVAGGMFTSTDPQIANQQAQQYAQDQANQHGSCKILYKSEAINAYYYSQNCPAGQGPEAYPVSLPLGMFTSTVDQLTANQLAQQYAQSQADQHGTCVVLPVSFYYDNEIGGPLTIALTNTSSGQTYTFSAGGHDSGTLGDVLPGTYNITVYGSSYFYADICGYYQEGPSPLTFYGISTNGCNYISIY